MELARNLSEIVSGGYWLWVLKGFELAAPHMQTFLQQDSFSEMGLALSVASFENVIKR